METLHANVVDLQEFSRKRSNAANAGALDECRALAAARLTEALGECLADAAAQLLDLAAKAPGMDLYHLHLDARDLAKEHASEITGAFRAEFLRLFDDASLGGSATPDSGVPKLELVAPDDLEENLAAQALATAIGNACAEELYGLGQRVGLLLDTPDLELGANPLGPAQIGAALMKALNALEHHVVGIKVRLLLVSILNRRFPAPVKTVYQALNQRLVQRGVLPTLRVGLRRRALDDASMHAGATEAAPEQDLFATLRRLVAETSHARAPVSGPRLDMGQPWSETWPTAESAPAHPAGTVFRQALERLQRGHALPEFGLGAAVPGADNALHALRGCRLVTAMTPVELQTLDIIALLFDYILDDRRVPDAMKVLIGRLRIPVLKVALRDSTFFARKSHPARALLDGLAAAAIGWMTNEEHDGGLYRRMDEIIQRVIDGYVDDDTVFVEALAELRAHLDAEAREMAARADQGARVLHDRERAAQATARARAEVTSRLLATPISGTLRAYVLDWWQPWLADIHLAHGEDDRTWKRALKDLDDLLASVAPMNDQDARRHFLESLPDLIRRLRADLEAMGRSAETREQFFAALVECHAHAIKGEADTVAAGLETMPMPSLAPMVEPDDFIDLPTNTDANARAPQTTLESTALPESAPGNAGLERGDWIEYLQADGAWLRARLFWISPLRGVYLFTNRLGAKAISISARGLEHKLSQGEIRVLDDKPLIDKAVDRMVGDLRKRSA